MNIGFDAKRAFLNYTGLGNYSREAINTMAEEFPLETYYLYTTKAPDNNRTASLFNRSNIVVRTPGFPFFRSLWRSRLIIRQLKKDRLDIFHGLSHELPFGIGKTGIRSVVTIHDLIFLRYPQYYQSVDRKIYEAKYRYACRHADKIVAISEQTKKDIQTFFGIDPARIEVIYQGCDPSFAQKKTITQLDSIKEKYGLPDRFLLNVGTVEERKNTLLIVKALTMLPDELKLVIVGRHTAYANEVKKYIEEHGLGTRVIFLENVSFNDLPGIYQLAGIFVYPSRFEGFGIPVLEALNSGVPVIAASGSCLEEAGGGGSIYTDPDNEKAMAAHVLNLMEDRTLRESIVNKGYEHAAGFSAGIMANKLMTLYRSITGNK